MITGQNKNKYMVLMAMYVVQSGIVNKIRFQYMLPGHSFLPCDRDFGNMEKVMKKKERISCPADYAAIAGSREQTRDTTLKQEDIYNWKALEEVVQIRRPKQPYLFSKARSITISSHLINLTTMRWRHPMVLRIGSTSGKQVRNDCSLTLWIFSIQNIHITTQSK